MFVISIVIISIMVQLAAAYMALRLIKVTQNQLSWIFIAVAMVLQASRRALTLIELINGQLDASQVQTSELIGLVLSVLMAVGVGSIEPFFLAQARSIAQRKQAEENLNEVSLYTRNLIEASLDPLVTISKDGKITDVNIATELATGVSREQLIGSDFSEYFTEPEKAREGYEQVFEKGFVKDYPLAIRHVSGSITDVLYYASVYKNAAGSVTGVFAAARDVTERKRAEEALRHDYEIQSVLNSLLGLAIEDKTLEEILMGSLDCILSISWIAVESKGSIFLVEDEPEVLVMKMQIGLSENNQEKCQRVPFGRCLCGRAAQMHEIQFADHLDDLHDIVYDGIKPHGHYCIPILLFDRTLGVINLYLKEGHRRQPIEETFLIAVADTLAGIIQRKRGEESLSKSESELSEAQRVAQIGNWEWDARTDTIVWSKELYHLFSIDPDVPTPNYLTHLELYVPESIERLNTAVKKAMEIGEPYELDLELAHPSTETIWIVARGEPKRDASGQICGLRGTAQNITQRKRAEEELRKYRDHLEELVKERTDELDRANIKLKELHKLKSMFIASTSHELRTPLNSIIGFSGMTLQGLAGELNEEQKDNLIRVNKSAEHLLSLITDIIDISKIEAGRVEVFPEPFSLHELIAEAVSSIQPQAKQKGLALFVDVPADIRMNTDRKRLLQCIINYMSNAVKFTEVGKVTILARDVDGDVEISVIDTGIGIAEKNIPKLFEAFERLESHLKIKAGGTGLGLYLTKKMATELLCGSVGVKSIEGKGSTFSLRIPKILRKEDEIK